MGKDIILRKGWVEEAVVIAGRNAISCSYIFDILLMIFYHSRLSDEPTGTIVSLRFLWCLSNVANSVETNVLHNTNPISRITMH